MTSREFIQLTAIFIKPAEAFDYFLGLLEKLARESGELRAGSSKLVSTQAGSNQAMAAQNELVSSLSRASQEIRQGYETRRVWAGVEELSGRTQRLGTQAFAKHVSDTLDEQLRHFSEAYEQFVKTYTASGILVLIHAGKDLHVSLESLRLVGALAEKGLGGSLPEETEHSLDLVLPITPTPHDMVEKLRALMEVYDKLCELLSVSAATNPLRIAKLETGTWWMNLLGHAGVITLLGGLLTAFARYCYNNYTKTGQIAELPRKAEAVEVILGLRQKLTDQGINTDGMDENIRKASVVISQKLETLIAGEPSVVINAVEIGIAGEKPYPTLEGAATPLLGDSADKTSTDAKPA